MAKKEAKSKTTKKATVPVETSQTNDLVDALIDENLQAAQEEVEAMTTDEPIQEETAPVAEEKTEEPVMTEEEARELGDMIDDLASGEKVVDTENEEVVVTVESKTEVVESIKEVKKPHAMRSGFGYYWNGWCCDE